MPFFEAKNLYKKFGDQVVLNDISFSLPSKGLISLTGVSGSGKSTLLKCLLGIIKLDGGEIRFHDKKIKDFEKFRNRYASFIFQNYSLISFLNPKENIEIGKRKNSESIEEIAKKLNVSQKLKQKTFTLSGGEKQRIAIARALISKPQIIFCDEPTGSLDETNGIMIMEDLKRISKERLVIVVSHNMNYVENYSDMIIKLERGKVFIKNQINENKYYKEEIKKSNELSFARLIKNSFMFLKFHFRKIIFSVISLSLSFCFFLLMLNSYVNISKMINNNQTRFLDYNLLKFSLNCETKLEGSNFTLVKNTRPTFSEIAYLHDFVDSSDLRFDVTPALPRFTLVYENENYKRGIESIEFIPYSHKMENQMRSYINGKYPININEVIINKKAKEILSSSWFDINTSREIDYLTKDNKVITDTYNGKIRMNVVGTIDDFSLIVSPRVYYSIDALEEYTRNIELENLSKEMNSRVTLYDRLTKYTYENDKYASCSMFLEVSDIHKVKETYRLINSTYYKNNHFSAENTSLELVVSFEKAYDSIYQVIVIFIAITLIISSLLLSLSLGSILNDSKIDFGIMLSSGIRKSDIRLMFIVLSITISFISVLFSTFTYSLSSVLINTILLSNIEIAQIPVRIPIKVFCLMIVFVIIFSLLSALATLARLNRLQIGEIMREE